MEYMDCRGFKSKFLSGAKRLLLLLPMLVTANAFAEEPVCAEVKVEIQQELTLERQAFDAMMRINNGLDTLAIENINVSVNFADENGNPVLATSNPNETNPDAKFFIRIDTMDGISDVTGNGIVAPKTSGEIHWLIIPIPGAAEGAPGGKLYYIGAHLSYTIGGEPEEVDVTPDFITVRPLPQLALDYFLTRDVVGDDAFTTEIEPAEPYTLGLRINNKGTGPAHGVAIDSGQPKITENEQGLLIGFTITGSTLDDQPSTPDLKMNFGDIAPASSRMGRWIMETTLSGEFTDFTASVSHSDELGGAVTSLIDANDVNTHYLQRDVRVDLPGRDNVRDFLAFSVGGTIDNLTVYESDTADSEVSNLSSSSTLVLNNQSGTESYYTLTVPVQPGFVYARLADPFDGTKAIKSIVRSDGKVISPDNGWNSKTRNRNTNPPSWEHWLNLFDVNSTGTYIVHIGEADLAAVPPVLQFINDKVTAEGKQVGFLVEASDANQDSIILSASPLPAGASFVDNGDGTAYFNWTPTEGQAGVYAITYKGSDGSLTATRSATIKVNPAWDTDGDGLDDAWEMEQFGSLDSDGSGDADGDGVSDLDEYLNGTDPNLPPPAIPSTLEGSSGNGESILSWSAVEGADSYRLYWSELPGLSQDGSAVIDDAISPLAHSGLVNGTTYYYALSAVGTGGESALSLEVAVTPGNRDWGIPGLVLSDSGSFANLQLAEAGNGTMLAVWTQFDGLHQSVWGTLYQVGSGWGTAQLIELDDTSDAGGVQIAMDEGGNALVAWRATNSVEQSVWANSYSAAGGWATPAKLSTAATGSLGELDIGTAGDGSGLLLWSQATGAGVAPNSVWSSHYAAASWSTASRIDAATVSGVNGLQLGVATDGSALAAWSQTSDGMHYDLIAANYSGATWQAAQTLRSAVMGDATAPQVSAQLAMNAGGEAVLVWGEAASPNSIYAQRYLPASGWASRELIEFDTASGAYHPTVAINASGEAVVAWQQSDGSNSAIYSNRYTVASGWATGAQKVSADSLPAHVGDALAPVVGIDRQGNVTLAWQQDDGVQSNVWSNRYEPGNGWLSAQIIETRNAGDALTPRLAMNESGDALAVWSQSDGAASYLVFNDFVSGNEGVPNIAPVALLPAEVSVDEQSNASVSGADSFDQDGSVASYSWSQLSGPVVTLSGADSADVSFATPTLTSAEVVSLRVVVTDNEGESAYADVAVQINPVNLAPTVSAGQDLSADEATTVSLNGSGEDSDGTIVSYQWTQLSGSEVLLEQADTPSANFIAPTVKTATVLQFQLSVEDNEGTSSIDVVSVTVNPVNHAPVVNASSDQSVDEQIPVNLVGTASDPDADGILTGYTWTQLSGTPVTLTNSDTLNASFTAPTLKQQIVLNFRLTVTDDESGVSSSDVAITVNPVNHVPVVSAGSDQSVDEQTTVSLTGTASDPDADGILTSYAWNQLSGTPVILSGADSLNASFTTPILKQAAVLSFRLTATDDEGGVSSDDVAITVNPVNHVPVVSAGSDQSVDEQTTVSLTGSASDPDVDGILNSTVWTQLGGTPVTLNRADTLNASFTAPTLKQTAVLSFRLTVTDDEGGVSGSDVAITVNPVNHVPVVSAGSDQSVDEQIAVSLIGSASDPDADGILNSTVWTQLSGTPIILSGADSLNASFTAPTLKQIAVLSFRLTVTDDEGGVSSDDVVITVNPVNHVPVVSAGNDQSVDEQIIVSLSGTASDPDADGILTSYAWNQLSGTPVILSGADSLNASFTAPTLKQAAVLSFRLTVTDDEGGVSVDEMSVTVNPVNHAPVVNAGSDQSVDEQVTVSLIGSASDPDVDGILTSYAWNQLSGTPVILSGADSLNASFTAPTLKQIAVLSFRLTVTDDEGGVSSDDVAITVNPVNHAPVVEAGSDQSVDEQTLVSLSGTASDPDADGILSSYAWMQMSGTPVTLSGADTLNASFTAPMLKQATVLSFRLSVLDDEGGMSFDELMVTVNPVNHAPVVSAGETLVLGENTLISLAGSVSDPDADGVITQITWTQISGPSVSLNGADTASASFTAPAVYQDIVLGFRLYAKDDEGGEAESFTGVTIYSTNPDDDADGMDDLWEILYFQTLNRDGTGDVDSDGATDLAEFGFATDPTVPQGPGQPSIASPDDIETTTQIPTLSVNNGEHHPAFDVSYEYEVYSDAAMSQRVAYVTDITEGSSQSSWVMSQPLQDNTWYYWRARAVGWVLVSEWVSSRFFVNTVNDAPEPFFVSSPANTTWVDTFSPNLSVTNSSDVDEDALSYGFNVYSNPLVPTLLTTVEGLPSGTDGTTAWRVDTTLEENNWYLWESVVTDEHGAQTMTERVSFFVNTVNDAPGIPTIYSPQVDEEVTVLSTNLVVTNAVEPEGEAVTYYFELDRVNTFDSADKRESGPLTEAEDLTGWDVSNLEDNTLYYWRVKASDGRAESTWTTASFFTNTVNDAPGVPMPQNPGNGAWVGSLTPALSVYPAVDIDRDNLTYDYEVYLANNRWMVGDLYAFGTTQPEWWQIAPQLEDAGWYYWRARAVDEHGLAGEWSEMIIFYADDDGVNDPPQITLKKLKSSENAKKSDVIGVQWGDRDPDSNASIALYYDTDGSGENGVLITDTLTEDPDGQSDSYSWDVSSIPSGVYYIYAVIEDGNSRVVEYSPNAVVVGDGGGHPFIALSETTYENGSKNQNVLIKWWDMDGNSNATISLYYDADNSGVDGQLIVSSIAEDDDVKGDRYLWDISAIPEGDYYTYAVIQDESQTYVEYSENAIMVKH